MRTRNEKTKLTKDRHKRRNTDLEGIYECFLKPLIDSKPQGWDDERQNWLDFLMGDREISLYRARCKFDMFGMKMVTATKGSFSYPKRVVMKNERLLIRIDYNFKDRIDVEFLDTDEWFRLTYKQYNEFLNQVRREQ